MHSKFYASHQLHYNYVLMYMASPEDGVVSDYFDTALERAAFVSAEEAAA